jgi:hypothetical protein
MPFDHERLEVYHVALDFFDVAAALHAALLRQGIELFSPRG